MHNERNNADLLDQDNILDSRANFMMALKSHNRTREKSFSETSFQLRTALKKDRNKAEMKERKKTTRHLQKYMYTADV